MNAHDRLEIIKAAVDGYRGDIHHLERALGMLILGDVFGWKFLYLVHDKKTIKKYEVILGINIRKAFPERGPMAKRSLGLAVVDKLGDFWKAVKGEISLPERRLIK